MKKYKLIRTTAEEDAAIRRGIALDPDTRELTDQELAQLRRPRGRPKVDAVKVLTSLRLDADLLDAIKATGDGWQTRINAELRKAFLRQAADTGVVGMKPAMKPARKSTSAVRRSRSVLKIAEPAPKRGGASGRKPKVA